MINFKPFDKTTPTLCYLEYFKWGVVAHSWENLPRQEEGRKLGWSSLVSWVGPKASEGTEAVAGGQAVDGQIVPLRISNSLQVQGQTTDMPS